MNAADMRKITEQAKDARLAREDRLAREEEATGITEVEWHIQNAARAGNSYYRYSCNMGLLAFIVKHFEKLGFEVKVFSIPSSRSGFELQIGW